MTVDELEAQMIGQQRNQLQQQQSLQAAQPQPGLLAFPPHAALPRPQPPPPHMQMALGPPEQLGYQGLHPSALGGGLPSPNILTPPQDRHFAGAPSPHFLCKACTVK